MADSAAYKMEYKLFKTIKTASDMEKYFDARWKSHRNKFYHYTNLDAIDKILENSRFRISNISRFNDLNDTNQFAGDSQLHYSLCFSVGKQENLPLWYLYSGVNGKGGRLGFTSNAINEMIATASFTLCEYNYDAPQEIREEYAIAREKDFLLEVRDFVYANYDSEKQVYTLRYSNLVNENLSQSEGDHFFDAHPGFKKGLIWSYEKETRIHIQLVGAMAELVTRNENKQYAIFMNFHSALRGKIFADLAPECDDKELVLKNHPNIRRLDEEYKSVNYSKHKGEIRMRL